MCSACCEELRRTNRPCPSCREPLSNVNPNRLAQRMVDKLKVICNECKTEMKRGKFDRHYNYECVIVCPQHCDIKTLTRQDIEAHLRDQCPETLLLCPHGCQQSVPRKASREHDAICPRYTVACPRCDALFDRQDTAAHDQLCPNLMLPCPFCDSQYRRRELESHKQTCDLSPSPCSASQFCDWKGTRGELSGHVQGCIFAKLKPMYEAQEARATQQDAQIRFQSDQITHLNSQTSQQDAHIQRLETTIRLQSNQINQLKTQLESNQRKVSASEFNGSVEQKHRSNIHFPLCDMSSLTLAGVDLTQAYFWNSNFSGVDLSGAILVRADLSNCNLSRSNLTRSNLSHSNLSHSNLSHSNLSHSVITGATLPRDLSHVNLSNVDFKGRDLSNHNLTGANLTGAIFTGATLSVISQDFKVIAASVKLSEARKLATGETEYGWPYSGEGSRGSAPWTVDVDFGKWVVLSKFEINNYHNGSYCAKDIRLENIQENSQCALIHECTSPQANGVHAWSCTNTPVRKVRLKVTSTYGDIPALIHLKFYGQ